MIRVHTIISGAQTGADRGALEAAYDLGLKRGGMAPMGWRSEDGEIPLWYRAGMLQSGSPAYPVRTRANVEASTGTLILSLGPLRFDSGSMLTAQIARTQNKPHLHVLVPFEHDDGVGRERVLRWLEDNRITTLNVAGPRESREPGLQAIVRRTLVSLLRIFDHMTVHGPEDKLFSKVAHEMRGGDWWTKAAPYREPAAIAGVIDPDDAGFGWSPD